MRSQFIRLKKLNEFAALVRGLALTLKHACFLCWYILSFSVRWEIKKNRLAAIRATNGGRAIF